ncbi:unnamed protein product [Ectocarpus sp. 13 AM-2016]
MCARGAQEILAVLAFSSSKKEPPVGKAAFPSRSGPVPAPFAAAAALAFSSPKNPSGGEVAFLIASFSSPLQPPPAAGPDGVGLSALRASRAARVFDIGFADGATGTAAATPAEEVSADGRSDPAAVAATANGAGATDPFSFSLAFADDSSAPASAMARALCCLVRSASTAGATFTGRRGGGGAWLSHPPADSRGEPIFLAAGSHAGG